MIQTQIVPAHILNAADIERKFKQVGKYELTEIFVHLLASWFCLTKWSTPILNYNHSLPKR